jgi:MYXO-CTERM domain-containing protein
MQLGKTGTIAVPAAFALLLGAKASVAGTIIIDKADDPNVGFNDPTTVDPVGNNEETTRGAQALAAFKSAAGIWSDALKPSVDIHVSARFAQLDCTILAKGEPTQYSINVPGGLAGTWYPLALANHLANADLGMGKPAINLALNGALGTSTCPGTAGWYFGLDSKSGDLTDLVTAVLHELGHGLGMVTPIDLQTGEFFQRSPDIFSTFVIDNRTGKRWSEMSATDRATSARDFHQLLWGGAKVTAAAKAQLTSGMPELALGGSSQDLDPTIVVANFSAPLTDQPVEGSLSTVADGCGSLPSLTGRVAFIEAGGTCTDFAKTLAVQSQGAVAAILVGTQTGFVPVQPVAADGEDKSKITIPSVAVNQADADAIRKALPPSASEDGGAGLTARLWANPDRGIGTSKGGQVYLDATDPVKPGSTATHWDPVAQPLLLMQPGYAQTNHELDLTLPLMQDIGWGSCGANCGPSQDGGTRDAGGSSGTGGSATIVDGGVEDAGDAAHVSVVNPNPPPPNHYVDAGPPVPEGGTGPGGIPWAQRPHGCNCRIETAESEPAAGLAAMIVGLAASMRRRTRRSA